MNRSAVGVVVLVLVAMATIGCEILIRQPLVRAGHVPAPTPKVKATVYCTNDCGPCERYVEDIRTEMPPDGWVVRDTTAADAQSAHIVIKRKSDRTDGIEAYPSTIIRDGAGVERDRLVGRQSPTVLAKAFNRVAKQIAEASSGQKSLAAPLE